MPFMKGIAPIRRTAKYLNAGGLVFKERVKIVTVNFNDLAESQSHKGAQAGTESVMDGSEPELQRTFFEDFGVGPLILDRRFCSYFRSK